MAAAARLRTPALTPLVDELARRFAEGTPVSRVSVRGLSGEQRDALADLFGSDRLPSPNARITLASLAGALGLDEADDLREAVECLRGPLGNRRAGRETRRQERDAFWVWAAEEAARVPVLAPDDIAGRWVTSLRATGIRGGTETHGRRLQQTFRVLGRLPAEDGPALASFADDHLGNPHALDRGTAVEGMVLDALALALGQDRPRDAEAARLLWELAGVAPDPLSSTALVLGLRPVGDDPLARWLHSAADVGEAAVITLAQLRRWPLAPLARSAVVYVVENPSLVAEAAARSWTGPAIVCSSGRPTVAVVSLLRQLGAAGAIRRQHADLDAAGLAITGWLADRAGTVPWRMTAAAYRRAAAVERRRVALVPPLPPTPWDPDLEPAMASTGVAVYEEELRGELLDAMAEQRLTADP